METQQDTFAIFVSKEDKDKLIPLLQTNGIQHQLLKVGGSYVQKCIQLNSTDEQKVKQIMEELQIEYRMVHTGGASEQDRHFVPIQENKSFKGPKSTRYQRFNPYDDFRLVQYAQEFKYNYHKIAELMPDYTPTQLRDRYQRYLNPKYKQTPMTIEDEKQLCDLVQIYGRSFVKISKIMGWSPNRLKTKYNSLKNLDDKMRKKISNEPEKEEEKIVQVPKMLQLPMSQPTNQNQPIQIIINNLVQIDENTFMAI